MAHMVDKVGIYRQTQKINKKENETQKIIKGK